MAEERLSKSAFDLLLNSMGSETFRIDETSAHLLRLILTDGTSVNILEESAVRADIDNLKRKLAVPEVQVIDEGRSRLEMEIAGEAVIVESIRGDIANDDEETKNLIKSTRSSYGKTWGGTPESNQIIEWDQEIDASPDTTHYRAQVYTGEKMMSFTERKTSYLLHGEHLPIELTGYKVVLPNEDDERVVISLAEFLQKKFSHEPNKRIAVIARAASDSGEVQRRFQGEKLLPSGVLFAMIQLLSLHEDQHPYWFCMLGWPLQYQILGLKHKGKIPKVLNFTKTEDMFGISPNGHIEMDRENPQMLEFIKIYLGYFLETRQRSEEEIETEKKLKYVKTESIAEVLKSLAKQKGENGEPILGLPELQIALKAAKNIGVTGLPSPENIANSSLDSEQIINILTTPKNVQCFIPVLAKHATIFKQLRERAADGPFSSTLLPNRWLRDVLDFLDDATSLA